MDLSIVVANGAVALNQGDFSFLSLFMQADIVVKIVMIGLAVASIWAWGIVFEKMIAIGKARKRSDFFEKTVLVWRTI